MRVIVSVVMLWLDRHCRERFRIRWHGVLANHSLCSLLLDAANQAEHGMDDGVARDVVVTNGGQEGLTRVFDALLPRGSSILVEGKTMAAKRRGGRGRK